MRLTEPKWLTAAILLVATTTHALNALHAEPRGSERVRVRRLHGDRLMALLTALSPRALGVPTTRLQHFRLTMAFGGFLGHHAVAHPPTSSLMRDLETYIEGIPLVNFEGDEVLQQIADRMNEFTAYKLPGDSLKEGRAIYQHGANDMKKEVVVLKKVQPLHAHNASSWTGNEVFVGLRRSRPSSSLYYVFYIYVRNASPADKLPKNLGGVAKLIEFDAWDHREDALDRAPATEKQNGWSGCSDTILLPCRSAQVILPRNGEQLELRATPLKPCAYYNPNGAGNRFRFIRLGHLQHQSRLRLEAGSRRFETEPGFRADVYAQFLEDLDDEAKQRGRFIGADLNLLNNLPQILQGTLGQVGQTLAALVGGLGSSLTGILGSVLGGGEGGSGFLDLSKLTGALGEGVNGLLNSVGSLLGGAGSGIGGGPGVGGADNPIQGLLNMGFNLLGGVSNGLGMGGGVQPQPQQGAGAGTEITLFASDPNESRRRKREAPTGSTSDSQAEAEDAEAVPEGGAEARPEREAAVEASADAASGAVEEPEVEGDAEGGTEREGRGLFDFGMGGGGGGGGGDNPLGMFMNCGKGILDTGFKALNTVAQLISSIGGGLGTGKASPGNVGDALGLNLVGGLVNVSPQEKAEMVEELKFPNSGKLGNLMPIEEWMEAVEVTEDEDSDEDDDDSDEAEKKKKKKDEDSSEDKKRRRRRSLAGSLKALEDTLTLANSKLLKKTPGVVYTHTGWKLPRRWAHSGASLQLETEPFVGFGICPHRPLTQEDWEAVRGPEDTVALLASALRTQCIDAEMALYRELLTTGLLTYNPFNKTLDLNDDSRLLKHKKLPRRAATLLARAFELAHFSRALHSELFFSRGPVVHSCGCPAAITRRVFTLGEALFEGVDTLRTSQAAHRLRLLRSLALTAKTGFLRLVADHETLTQRCLGDCSADALQNYNDAVHLMSILQFLIHGLDPVLSGGLGAREAFETFQHLNVDLIHDKVQGYNL